MENHQRMVLRDRRRKHGFGGECDDGSLSRRQQYVTKCRDFMFNMTTATATILIVVISLSHVDGFSPRPVSYGRGGVGMIRNGRSVGVSVFESLHLGIGGRYNNKRKSRRHHLSASSSTRGSAPSSESVLLNSEDNDGGGSATEAGGLVPPFQVTLDNAENYSYRDAVFRTLGWVSAAIVFGFGMFSVFGPQAGEEFFAGYLVEQSLSIDNLFVFLLLFEYFKVPLQYQDRVLNWGIYGAVVMRAIMIGIGAAALHKFHALLLVFAAILVYSSGKFFIGMGDEDDEEDPGQNSIVRFSRSLFPSTDFFDGDRFFTIADGVKKATPLFICMVAVEISDVVFAVDSIPAVFGVTENPLVVFTSNIFAIMGLRSLYTILSKAATDLKYLEPAVALVLGFIGIKMVLEYFGLCIPTNIALGVVATMLSTGVGASVYDKQRALESTTNDN